MDTRVRPLPMDPRTMAMLQRSGDDPQKVEELMGRVLSYVHYGIRDPPVTADARLSALGPHDSVDRLSLLPDALLRTIVSRLPAKDAARTSALSRRWRPLWLSAPLVLVDADFLPDADTSRGGDGGRPVSRADARRVTAAVSRALAAHPGPFRCVHLTSSYMEEHRGLLSRWLQALAVKAVQELVLVNRPWPLDTALPSTFFGMATLTRLHLGLWKFPDTADLPRAVSFPHLRELGLSLVGIEDADMDFVLARSPVLYALCLEGNVLLDRVRLGSRSLRCVQMKGSQQHVEVVNAPRLERLILLESCTSDDGKPVRVKIGRAPSLRVIGYLEPGQQQLEVGNTIIKASTKASPSTMVPSVKILALKVQFGVRNDAKMLPNFLRCFPKVTRLHIDSEQTDEPTGKLNLKFWQEAGAIECIKSHIDLMVFRQFRGERGELAFLKFFLESAQVLRKLLIVFTEGTFSVDEANAKVKPLFAAKWANARCSLVVFENAENGEDACWNFERGSNFSIVDPFGVLAQP